MLNFLFFLFSLKNTSNDIRWSIDLRWQSPKVDYGFYGIADGILFRKDGKDVEPDWEKFLSVDRKEVWQKKYFKQVGTTFSSSRHKVKIDYMK